MVFFISLETPGYAVTIHRDSCRYCNGGTFRPQDRYLSWSGPYGRYDETRRHVAITYGFFAPPIDCPVCSPALPDAGKKS